MAKPKTIRHSRAFEIQEDIAAWMRTDGAFEHMATDQLRRLSLGYKSKAEVIKEHGDEMVAMVLHEVKAFIADRATFCSSDFSTMLLAMTETAPQGYIGPGDVSSKSGFLVFAEPITVPAAYQKDPVFRGVRAISFDTQDLDGEPVLLIRYWAEEINSRHEDPVQGRNKIRAGRVGMMPLTDNEFCPAFGLVRLLRSYFALVKSPVADAAIEPRNPKVSPRTKRSLPADSIRRVYLRHPEHARYEADEAAAAREGRAPVRAHWVRGHWRNQPYPKTGDVKWIWIDGYIKGNPENGTVTTRQLQVARASKAEVRELVGV